MFPLENVVEGKIETTAYPQRPESHKPQKRSKSSAPQFAKTTGHLVVTGIKPQEVAANMRASMVRFARLPKVTND